MNLGGFILENISECFNMFLLAVFLNSLFWAQLVGTYHYLFMLYCSR